jgi:F0F1-type ATP synthase assembly protein I
MLRVTAMPFNRPIPDDQQRSKPSVGFKAWVEAEKLIQIAFLLPSSVCIGWLGGALVDKWLHQSWVGLVGMVVGGISGLVYAIKLAMASVNDSANGAGTENGNGKGSSDKP